MIEQEPQPGDFAVVRMSGAAGRLIRLGQWLAGGGYADFEHAFVLVDDGQVLEAEPHGARLRPVSEYDGRPIEWSTGRIELTDEQRAAVVRAEMGYLGTPYSFLYPAAIAAHRFHLPGPWLRRYVASSGHMICSQLCDRAYQDAGVQLFHDHRWPGWVTPADLYRLLARGGEPR